MKALVTGGAGFIGSNLVRFLVEAGHEVVVLDNLSSGYARNLAPFREVTFIEGDIRDVETVSRAVAGIEVVFHTAASVGNLRSIEFPVEDSQTNVMGTLHLLEASRAAAVRRFIYSSSAAIFGELKVLPINESHPLEPDSPYGVSKLGAEKLCLVYTGLYELECVCLRYFNVYGNNQRYDAYGNVIPIFAHRAINGEPLMIFGDGEQTRDFVNVKDVALANYRAATTEGVTGVFNIASGTRITINRLAELVIKASGRKTSIRYSPPRRGDVRHSLADISAARQALGFQPQIDLESGLKEYLEWTRQELSYIP